MNRIVVGLIDTPPSRAALHWAVEQAAATGALIDVVTCVQPQPLYVWSDLVATSVVPPLTAAALRAETVEFQDRLLRREFGVRVGVVPLRATVIAGEAAHELARAATDADLLVVGRSHRRPRWLRRSIGDRCSRLVDTPVVLVPSDHRDGGTGNDVPVLRWLHVPDVRSPVDVAS